MHRVIFSHGSGGWAPGIEKKIPSCPWLSFGVFEDFFIMPFLGANALDLERSLKKSLKDGSFLGDLVQEIRDRTPSPLSIAEACPMLAGYNSKNYSTRVPDFSP